MWGALSGERTGLSFARVTAVVSLLSLCTIYILHVIKRLYIHNMYMASVRADHAILLVALASALTA
jgi:hypothetical protein